MTLSLVNEVKLFQHNEAMLQHGSKDIPIFNVQDFEYNYFKWNKYIKNMNPVINLNNYFILFLASLIYLKQFYSIFKHQLGTKYKSKL